MPKFRGCHFEETKFGGLVELLSKGGPNVEKMYLLPEYEAISPVRQKMVDRR
jgi:hypothetical protein